MQLKKRGDEEPVIDVGAFSDIAFLLIIFFILTTTFVKDAGNKMNIPSGSSDSSEQSEKNLTINLKGDQILYGEDSLNLNMESLRDKLFALKLKEKPENERMVIVDSDADVKYEQYYKVVMAITAADGVLALVEQKAESK